MKRTNNRPEAYIANKIEILDAKRRNGPMFKHILVSLDGSTHSRKALDIGIGLAKALGSQISIVSVEEHLSRIPTTMSEVEEEKEGQDKYFKNIQSQARQTILMSGLELQNADILTGHIAKSIINYAKKIKCDLIVMGHSGLSGAWANFLGTTAEKISHHAECTVMIVR
jgi:nucleotide-binding universal stress UspA family protein